MIQKPRKAKCKTGGPPELRPLREACGFGVAYERPAWRSDPAVFPPLGRVELHIRKGEPVVMEAIIENVVGFMFDASKPGRRMVEIRIGKPSRPRARGKAKAGR